MRATQVQPGCTQIMLTYQAGMCVQPGRSIRATDCHGTAERSKGGPPAGWAVRVECPSRHPVRSPGGLPNLAELGR